MILARMEPSFKTDISRGETGMAITLHDTSRLLQTQISTPSCPASFAAHVYAV